MKVIDTLDAAAPKMRPFFWGSSKAFQRADGEAMTIQEAITAADLDFEVEKFPLGAYVPRPGTAPKFVKHKDDKMHGIVRMDTHELLGKVGKRYVPLQNRAAFEFASDIVDSGEAVIEVAGSVKGGEKMFVVLRLVGTGVKVAGIEEEIQSYLTLINSHTGNQSVTGIVSPVRPECSNLLNYAQKNASGIFRVRHTATMEDKLAIQSGREALGLTVAYMGEFEKSMERLLADKYSDRRFESFLSDLVPMPEAKTTRTDSKTGETKEIVNRGVKVAEERREQIRAAYHGADNIDNIRGTAYGVLNAVSEVYQHETEGRVTRGKDGDEDRVRAENRTERLLGRVGLDHKAHDLLLSRA